MTGLMTKLFLIIAFLASVVSCTKDMSATSGSKDTQAVHKMSVSALCPTKTVIREITKDTNYEVLWQSGDALGVFEVTGEGVASEKTVSEPLEEGGSQASFNFTFTGTPTGPFHYSFVSPEWALTKEGGKYLLTLPSVQDYVEGSFDPAADVLVGEPVMGAERPASVDVRFARVGATAKMLIKAPTTTEKLRRITFSTTEGFLAGSYEIDPATGKIEELSGSSKEIVLTPASITDYSGNFEVWFRLAAITLTDNFTVKVETDAKTYTKQVNLGAKTLEFANSSLTTFTVNMTGVAGVSSWDVINLAFTQISGNAYAAWGPSKGSYSQAEYSGNNCMDGDNFRMRTSSNTGIVTKTSGGYVQAVTINLPIDPSAPRTVDIYASNTAYSSPEDLFEESTRGTKVGSVTASATQAVSQTVWLNDAYKYVAFRSNNNSTLVQSISIKWEDYPPYTQSGGTSYDVAGLLEMPSYSTEDMAGTTTSSLDDLYQVTHSALMGGKVQRNYTILYDPAMYASYWVAYPLCADHMTTGRKDSWAFDPDVPSSKQTRLDLGAYGVNYSGKYTNNYYARGHQIPNADRNNVEDMQAQTYYSTNITPQLQHGLNGLTWANLEGAVRGVVPSGDTLYVVTGAAFRRKGGSETINYITNQHDGKSLPVPNYYWKALLKVKRNVDGSVTNACTIGFWLAHHDNYEASSWQSANVSVDQIEAWTGFDLFANLSQALQDASESNTSWSVFTAF